MIDLWLACGLQTVLVLIVMTGIKKWWKWAYARQVEYKSISLKISYNDNAENNNSILQFAWRASIMNDAEKHNYLASPSPRSNSTKKELLDAALVGELAGG